MTDDEYTSFVRALADKIDFRHYPDWGKRYAGVLDEGRHTVANEGAIHDKFVGNTLQDAVGLIMVLYHYRRAKGLPIDDLELPDLSGFFGGDEEAEPESEASIAAPDESTLPAQDFGQIPEALAKYAEADESAEDFRRRAFNLLFRFGIAEGENFEGGGEPLTPEEKIKLLPMLIANFNAGNWLKLTEDLNPQA